METRTKLAAFISSLAFVAHVSIASAQDVTTSTLGKTVVLVHAAFAGGSSLNKVIPLLQQTGLKVVAVQNSLDYLEGDVTATNRAIVGAAGPVVLVGHSLVYVAADAPAEGKSVLDTIKSYPQSPG
jgi:orotate phosphoribosyltransferase